MSGVWKTRAVVLAVVGLFGWVAWIGDGWGRDSSEVRLAVAHAALARLAAAPRCEDVIADVMKVTLGEGVK